MHKYYEINTPGNNIRCKLYYNEKVQPEKAVVLALIDLDHSGLIQKGQSAIN